MRRSDVQPEVLYRPDEEISLDEDRELRRLLSTCFTGPAHGAFLERRYYLEPPEHRWLVRSESNDLLAHAALRARLVESEGGSWFVVGGISEVCVQPDHRGRGYVRLLMGEMHRFLAAHSFHHALLFGKREVYASSGYRPALNTFRFWCADEFRWKTEAVPSALVHGLTDTPWPRGVIDLKGVLY